MTYNQEVDNYKFFVLNENKEIITGYESKFDAMDYIEGEGMEDEFKVYTKRYLISQGYDVEGKLNYWKSF